jgi:predicted RNA-binding protein with PIN domain
MRSSNRELTFWKPRRVVIRRNSASCRRVLQFSMALLIDGYNLLNVTGIFGGEGPGTALHRTRMAFLNSLATSFTQRERNETTIVFDAAGAPPGLPRTIAHDGMTIHFAHRHSSADEMIEELLETWRAPRSLTVVSSDHRVQRAARHCGASFIDSEVWYANLLTAQRKRTSEQIASAKPTGKPTPDELAYWLKEFGEGPAVNAESEELFPPGYADDMSEDS